MIHDDHLSCQNAVDDRRSRSRQECIGEAIIRWSHDFATPIRYALADRSEGGLRILSRLPLAEGMTGVVSRFLPEGEETNQPVMVAWTSREADDDGYFSGLWFFGTP